jgi:hypothetical protein
MNIQEVDAMSVQQAIEYSLDKLVKQGKRCMNDSDCAYGNGEGNHCAIGWLLEADNKDLMKSGGSVNGIIDEWAVFLPSLIINNQETFTFFQGFHDALYKKRRSMYKGNLKDSGIDTSHSNFQAWIDLGK